VEIRGPHLRIGWKHRQRPAPPQPGQREERGPRPKPRPQVRGGERHDPPALALHRERQRLRGGVEQDVAMRGLVGAEAMDERGRVLVEAALGAARIEEDADVQALGRSSARATATTWKASSVTAAAKSKPPNQASAPK